MQEFNPENINVIFFDVDDTLFDKEKAHKMALQQIMKKYDIFKDIDESELFEAFKRADKKCVEDFDNGVPMGEIRWRRSKRVINYLQLKEDFTDIFHDVFLSTYPCMDTEIEGAVETIRTLNESYRLGVITNSTKETQFKKLNTLCIEEYFDEFVFSESVGSRKPDEKIFHTAVKRVDEEPGNCLYVGDSFRRDVKGANKIGMHTYWFNRGGKKKIEQEIADLEITELKQLLDIL